MRLTVIFALQAWALWLHSRIIGLILVVSAALLFTPTLYTMGRDMTRGAVWYTMGPHIGVHLPQNRCSANISSSVASKAGGVQKHVSCILFNAVTLSLTSIVLYKWWKGVPGSIRSPVMNSMVQTTAIYSFLLLASGIPSIYFLLSDLPAEFATAASLFHILLISLSATSIVQHLAGQGWQNHESVDVALSSLRFEANQRFDV
ncbi:hypothetical protein HGRIS_004518 [Hohenbuehelia grisea]|uniref:Uncharacterized protein n=1 Tax=Hohenbuehelia grisea TaxID=104357 RepID=A0ABR3JC52_9AGAR